MTHWDAMGLAIFTAVLSCLAFGVCALFGVEHSSLVSRNQPAHGAGHMVAIFMVPGFMALALSWAAVVNAPLEVK